MKSTALVNTIALLAAVFSVAAQAQTGRPSTTEVRSAQTVPRAAATDADAGSYARYLMLNGTPRDEALAAARNIDHPAVRGRVASRTQGPVDAKVPTLQ